MTVNFSIMFNNDFGFGVVFYATGLTSTSTNGTNIRTWLRHFLVTFNTLRKCYLDRFRTHRCSPAAFFPYGFQKAAHSSVLLLATWIARNVLEQVELRRFAGQEGSGMVHCSIRFHGHHLGCGEQGVCGQKRDGWKQKYVLEGFVLKQASSSIIHHREPVSWCIRAPLAGGLHICIWESWVFFVVGCMILSCVVTDDLGLAVFLLLPLSIPLQPIVPHAIRGLDNPDGADLLKASITTLLASLHVDQERPRYPSALAFEQQT